MFLRNKVIVGIILFLGTIVLSINSLEAGWWEDLSLPVPPSTQEVKKERRKLAGSEFTFIYYESSLGASNIKDFYRQRLTNAGWQEKNLLKEAGNIPNFQIDPNVANALSQNLNFEKDKERLFINFLPENFAQDGKTRFTIGKGETLKPGQAQKQDGGFGFELLDKPKKEVAPVYPKASLIDLSEQEHSSTLTYSTKDDIEPVVLFYKNNMANYGWNLIEEEPIEKKDFSTDLEKYDLAQVCPSCAKNKINLLKSMEMQFARLKFTNPGGDSCDIVINSMMSGEAGAGSLRFTNILVRYDEQR
jgi:hypothetical protein